jgi:hypothetical protein
MKKTILTITTTALFGISARADDAIMTATNTAPAYQNYPGEKRLGVGVIVGEPTGASVKYWLNDTLAVDGAAGWSFHDHSDLVIQGDLLWHDFDLLPVSHGRLPVYVGAGGLARFRNDHYDNQVGLRVPVGVSYMFDNAPVDIFAEVAPVLDVAPNLRGEITGGIGIRYWF